MQYDKKRILLITENLGSGGAERQLCGLAVLLREKGYRVKVITYIKRQFYETYLYEQMIDYELIPKLANKYLRAFRLTQYLWKYRPDVLISYLPSVNMAACLARLFFKTNLIVSERNTNQVLTIKDRILFELYRQATYIVPNSYSQAKFIETHYPKYKNKIQTIINFVDIDYFVPPAGSIKNEVLNVVTVARFTSQKNFLRYIEAIKIVKNKGLKVHFEWYGDSRYEVKYYLEMVDKIKELEVSDYITIHEPSNNIIEVYQKADLLCLPSLYEGYPNVLCEAMSCGLPVICSNVCENPLLVRDNVNGYLFDPFSVESIADAINKMFSCSLEERKRMGRQNRKCVIAENSRDVFVKRYIKLFE